MIPQREASESRYEQPVREEPGGKVYPPVNDNKKPQNPKIYTLIKREREKGLRLRWHEAISSDGYTVGSNPTGL